MNNLAKDKQFPKFEEQTDEAGFCNSVDSRRCWILKQIQENANLEPRQNVIFELGYLLGKFGRRTVYALSIKESAS